MKDFVMDWARANKTECRIFVGEFLGKDDESSMMLAREVG
jgi:hypothetical protein